MTNHLKVREDKRVNVCKAIFLNMNVLVLGIKFYEVFFQIIMMRQLNVPFSSSCTDFAANGLDNSLTEVLNVPEFADFLKKLVGSEESLPPTAPAAQPNQDRSRHNSGHKLTSPSRGRVRPDSRTDARPGGRKREEGGAAVAAEGGISDHHHISGGSGGSLLPDEIAEYLNKPDEFEDLLDECCG